ncbi:MAG TPA: 4a-hydroxytetrahydrobiopterin dehydratase [Oleiagrimonas sp.]|nr:4a-hydroxytetrahydrobiopterin dehydratase [Oleiagrimonas sp.]
MTFDELATSHCKPRKGESALDAARSRELLGVLDGWEASGDGKAIARDFKFKDFHRTLGFVNAVGYIANREDHHPDLEAGYGHCRVRWSTHDVDGLSMNDFICAAKVEALVR